MIFYFIYSITDIIFLFIYFFNTDFFNVDTRLLVISSIDVGFSFGKRKAIGVTSENVETFEC